MIRQRFESTGRKYYLFPLRFHSLKRWNDAIGFYRVPRWVVCFIPNPLAWGWYTIDFRRSGMLSWGFVRARGPLVFEYLPGGFWSFQGMV